MNASLPGRRDSIYVLKDGLRYGPYSIDQLQEQLDTAFFGPEQFASFNGSHNWRQIRELVGIAPKSFTVKADQKQNLPVNR